LSGNFSLRCLDRDRYNARALLLTGCVDKRKKFWCTVLRTLSTNVLAELVGDMERRIRLHSESLVEELALRDELDFAKEQRNQFIWLLLRVQKRRHQLLHRQQQQQHDDSCQSNTGVSDQKRSSAR